jgi:hypothetical protein
MDARWSSTALKRSGFGLLAALALAATSIAAPPAETQKPPGTLGSREALGDAWLSSDAVVTGTYRGVDSTLGPAYHVVDVTDVWMGTPARGRLVFKAPRGMRGDPGTQTLLFFWDRLAGAPDGFLEESKARYGDKVWAKIGPDSLASYLLPFPSYSYPYEKNKMVLRGQSAFLTEIPMSNLKDDMLAIEEKLQPPNLYKQADLVVRARVEKVVQQPRVEYGAVVERRVYVAFRKLETVKGTAPDTLGLRYPSVPRAPRFKQDSEVILFLGRTAEGFLLPQGKRCVLHVEKGEVLETGRPLSEFLKSLRGS